MWLDPDEAWDARYDDRPATESEAHAEWHRNAGVPMGTPGCPQDACHADESHEDYEATNAAETWTDADLPEPVYVPFPAPDFDPDDLPF